jgi:hypothetical protein
MLKFSMRNFHIKLLSNSNSEAYCSIFKPCLHTTATRLFHTSLNPFYRFSWNSIFETFINFHIISIFVKVNIFQRTPPPCTKLWSIPFPVLFITRTVVRVSTFQMITLFCVHTCSVTSSPGLKWYLAVNCNWPHVIVNVTYLIDALLGGSSVDAVRYATVEEAVFSACPFGWRAVTSVTVPWMSLGVFTVMRWRTVAMTRDVTQ